MKLFPIISSKILSECTHGEFVKLSAGNNSLTGITIRTENDACWILFLEGSRDVSFAQVRQMPDDTNILSFGTDWVVGIDEPLGGTTNNVMNIPGALIISRMGVHVAGSKYESVTQTSDSVLVNISNEGMTLAGVGSLPPGKHAFQKWSITVQDKITGRSHRLLQLP